MIHLRAGDAEELPEEKRLVDVALYSIAAVVPTSAPVAIRTRSRAVRLSLTTCPDWYRAALPGPRLPRAPREPMAPDASGGRGAQRVTCPLCSMSR